ncbi:MULTISPECIES: DUF1254 domain-containing protein [Nocardia]|uniref:DUF1254 domain-containing protein n=1 Tax=Nocardia sputorum TaxID=2984338 RepID=A0ABN6U8W9_9NOCA|nr:DUF1254 domain-containing protein [Nocardia sputorum]BDT95116.1 hypothetical protein IFM12275_50920 [Nocardia sputorum]BDU01627.1 hypothetical protein IFM12276_46550 [Nocardia sputorum]
MDQRTEGKLTVSRRRALGIAATSVAAFGWAACGRSGDDSSVPDDAATIAKDAYVFGYPLVLMDVTRIAAEASTPVNRFEHAAELPTPAQREAVRLDRDTLRSTAWLDLANEPMVLSVPAMDRGRFWLAQVLDAWTNNVHNPSGRRPQARSASPPYTYVVTGPGWSGALPEGLTPLPMPTPTVWLIVRIQVDGETDLPAVRAIQQRLRLVPLSAWVAGAEPPAPAAPPWQAAVQPPPEWVAEMDAKVFFDRMCAVLAVNPPAREDEPAMRRFATIGIRPGGAVEGLSEDELAAAVGTAQQQIPVYLGARTVNENGWLVDPDVGRYGVNYLLRAAIARVALGASLAENAFYPTLFASTATGDGAGRFRLHFTPGGLPPVDNFWSLTAYDADSYLVPNPAEIYTVGHPDPVLLNPDGSVDIALQYADPGPAVPAGNWLPIPESGQFSLTLRMYAPKPEAIQGRWRPPPLLPVL